MLEFLVLLELARLPDNYDCFDDDDENQGTVIHRLVTACGMIRNETRIESQLVSLVVIRSYSQVVAGSMSNA